MDYILTKYIHLLAILLLFSTCVAEHLLISDRMQRAEVKRLAKVDVFFGVSAFIVLLSGLAMMLWVGKPTEYYLANWMFHLKFTVFIVVALLSIYPTIYFIKTRKAGELTDMVELPKIIKIIIRVELLGIIILPLLGVMMASGFGISG
ncbi:DUF2214 family protein [Spartinivicinus poritis]|uniref:DUF2214 family protein n=1 Tax=Spartinivicinus poritis TaxID=2994640 RepID=A0ABT5UAM0_9GAMM|nr:DUF2214 family protein [Spartinivicinus sp. A2-2]MDE1463430.1 DUF2214 family protein [Spartinivicinus sp. A2-2]